MPLEVTIKFAMLVPFKLWHFCSPTKNRVCIMDKSQIKERKGGKRGALGAEGKEKRKEWKRRR